MECAAADNAASYHPRNPRASPLFRLLEEHYAEFERVYPERYQQRYGFWRPVIRKAVLDFLKCGDLREGFARVRCPDCGHEFFVAFSCKQRYKSRGRRAKAATSAAKPQPVKPVIEDDDTPYRKKCRMRWAALLKKVYEVDPLVCPKCGGRMKIVAFIERRDQPAVVERILKHCGLWADATARGPPAAPPTQDQLALELQYVDTDEFLAAL